MTVVSHAAPDNMPVLAIPGPKGPSLANYALKLFRCEVQQLKVVPSLKDQTKISPKASGMRDLGKKP